MFTSCPVSHRPWSYQTLHSVHQNAQLNKKEINSVYFALCGCDTGVQL
jgi:hypothetical protein